MHSDKSLDKGILSPTDLAGHKVKPTYTPDNLEYSLRYLGIPDAPSFVATLTRLGLYISTDVFGHMFRGESIVIDVTNIVCDPLMLIVDTFQDHPTVMALIDDLELRGFNLDNDDAPSVKESSYQCIVDIQCPYYVVEDGTMYRDTDMDEDDDYALREAEAIEDHNKATRQEFISIRDNDIHTRYIRDSSRINNIRVVLIKHKTIPPTL